MSDEIDWHCYTCLETKREKEIRIMRCTHTRTITDNIPDTETDREKERERNADQDTYLFTYNQWQYSQTQIEVFREKNRRKKNNRPRDGNIHLQYSRTLLQSSREKEKIKHDQETCMHIQFITYADTVTDIQSQREQTYLYTYIQSQ